MPNNDESGAALQARAKELQHQLDGVLSATERALIVTELKDIQEFIRKAQRKREPFPVESHLMALLGATTPEELHRIVSKPEQGYSDGWKASHDEYRLNERILLQEEPDDVVTHGAISLRNELARTDLPNATREARQEELQIYEEELSRRGLAQGTSGLRTRNPSIWPSGISIVFLVLAALFRWPYGFYELLRLVVCGSAIYVVNESYQAKIPAWPWIMGAMAVLFNPIISPHLRRGDWRVLNVIGAVVFVISIPVVCFATRSQKRFG